MRSFLIAASLSLAAAAIGTTASAQGATPGVTDKEIKIGQTMPYSGPASAFGTVGRAATAYFNKINAEGGINGRRIRLLSQDDGFSPAKTVEQTRMLVEQEQVAVMFGTVGTATNASVQKYLNSRKVPQLLVGAGASRFADPATYPWTTAFVPPADAEMKIIADHLVSHHPEVRIGVLFQNDEVGKDYLAGLRKGLGDRARTMLIKEVSYEITDPSVDAQIIELHGSGATAFVFLGLPRAASQALRKVHDIGWNALRIVAYPSNSVESVMKAAGVERTRGVLSVQFMKDPTDPRWQSDRGVLAFRDFMKTWYPEGSPTDSSNVAAYTMAQVLVHVLTQCGNDLSRANILKQAHSIRSLELPMLLPGITVNTSADRPSAVHQMEVIRFDGVQWAPVADSSRAKK